MKKLYFLLLLLCSGMALADPPEVQPPSPLATCDINNLGFGSVDLTSKEPEILGALNAGDYQITYYHSFTDATVGAGNEIANPTGFTITISPTVIFMRVTETANPANFAVEPLEVLLYPSPSSNFIADLEVSEIPFNGFAQFNLTLRGQQAGCTTTYYLTEADAQASVSPIFPATNYTNTSNPQYIYVRTTAASGCTVVNHFLISVTVNSGVNINIPDPNFKASLVAAGVDTSGDGEIQTSEALVPTLLDMPNANISDVTGISYFTNVQYIVFNNNHLSSLDLGALTGLVALNCNGNQLTSINVNGLTHMVSFFCNNNQLTALDLGAMNLSGLKYFDCSGNQLTFLGLNNLPALLTLDCSFNQLPSIDISTLPAMGVLKVGNNQLTSLTMNVSANPALGQLFCNNNNLTSLDITDMHINTLTCSFNQISNLVLTGAGLYELICKNNQLTTLDLSAQTGLARLDCAFNNLVALNLNGLTLVQELYVDMNHLTSLDLHEMANLNWMTCMGNQIVYLNMKNGHDYYYPASYFLFDGNPVQYICADEDNIGFANAAAAGAGISGVQVNSYCSFQPGGTYNLITGHFRFDANNDGCDPSDTGVPNARINISDGNVDGAAFTSNAGEYSFYVQNYTDTLTPSFENPYFNVTPASAPINFATLGGLTQVQDFCVTANGVHKDLEIVIAPVVPARPGFDAVYKIVYKNKGNQAMSQQYGVTFSFNANLLSLINAIPAAGTQNAGTLTWDFANLMPFESRSILVTMHVNAPTDANPVNVNDILTFTSIISPQSGDETVNDNIFVFNQTVTGSFDPNDITCIEGDVVSPAEIGNYLHYIINFENTGTDQAENIIVRDLIDEGQFDMSSLRVMNSSHPVDARIQGNKAEFIFKDIHLEIGGHGNILLKIKSNTSLVAGDIVSNKADIFFDYNHPVATLPANTIFQSLGVNEYEPDNSIAIYPNPTNGVLNLKSQGIIKSVQLFDIQGRILQTSLVNETTASIDILGKQTGVYFVKIASDKGIRIEKIIKN